MISESGWDQEGSDREIFIMILSYEPAVLICLVDWIIFCQCKTRFKILEGQFHDLLNLIVFYLSFNVSFFLYGMSKEMIPNLLVLG